MKGALDFGQRSAPGHHHRTNEDALGSDPARQLWLVADGMGGHAAGDVAANLVRDRVLAEVAEGAELPAAIEAAHQAVLASAAADEGRHGMGSTVVAVQLGDGEAQIAWVGDSRAYLLRAGTLRCLTRDHSLVHWLLEQNEITAEEAASHPDRNVLIRTLGFEQPTAELATLTLEPDDLLLLCSDGLTGVLSEAEIRRILLQAAAPQDAADRLIETVLARAGRDDASAIVIKNPSPARRPSRLWLPIAGGIVAGVLAYLIWNWMNV